MAAALLRSVLILVACTHGGHAIRASSRPALASRSARRPRCPAVTSDSSALLAAIDEWFNTAPYQSAFCVTAFKATLSDLLAQTRERRQAAETRMQAFVSGNSELEVSSAATPATADEAPLPPPRCLVPRAHGHHRL